MNAATFEPDDQHRALLHFCLQRVVDLGGSDLHVREGEPPYVRRNGALGVIPETRPLEPAEVAGMVGALTEHAPARRAEFIERGEADLSFELPGVARYRVNVFRERGRAALTLRVIPGTVPSIDDIGVPPIVRSLALEHHGLILVTGATGSGKTTTLAAMIDHRNRETASHILTIEDPIEIVHPNHQSIVSQREVGSDTGDFAQALRRALRQDPDVILIGEIRDEETMRTALAAAETGHLVLATLHTINAQESIARILDLFPSEAEMQARAMLAGALKGIVSQRLARTVDDGRAAVVEVLVNTSRIADCITNPEETGKVTEAMAAGEYYGMQTFDQALIKLIMAGRVSIDEGSLLTTSPQNFKLALEAARGQAQVRAQHDAAASAAAADEQRHVEAAQAQTAQMQAAQQPVPVPGAAPAGAYDPSPVAPPSPAYAPGPPVPTAGMAHLPPVPNLPTAPAFTVPHAAIPAPPAAA